MSLFSTATLPNDVFFFISRLFITFNPDSETDIFQHVALRNVLCPETLELLSFENDYNNKAQSYTEAILWYLSV